jgi:hypothetical protein
MLLQRRSRYIEVLEVLACKRCAHTAGYLAQHVLRELQRMKGFLPPLNSNCAHLNANLQPPCNNLQHSKACAASGQPVSKYSAVKRLSGETPRHALACGEGVVKESRNDTHAVPVKYPWHMCSKPEEAQTRPEAKPRRRVYPCNKQMQQFVFNMAPLTRLRMLWISLGPAGLPQEAASENCNWM